MGERSCSGRYAAHQNSVGTYNVFTILLGSIPPLFYRYSYASTAHFNAVSVAVTYEHNSDYATRSTVVGATFPIQCRRWVTCLFRELECPCLCSWLCGLQLRCPLYSTVRANATLTFAVGCVTLCCAASMHYFSGEYCPFLCEGLCDPLLCCLLTLQFGQMLRAFMGLAG